MVRKDIDTCRYYRYDAGRIVSNLGCTNCHLLTDVERKNDKGWTTFEGLALMDSLKLLDYTFTKKHKGWYADTGSYKGVKMDTLNDCEIRSLIRYIKDFGRDIPMPVH
ncbi:hypothetical protein EV200_105155 [Pedobacter psychrotolerans]|nr:hypothetical protein EV200_105155 [Pedobacter psychrotolerans]